MNELWKNNRKIRTNDNVNYVKLGYSIKNNEYITDDKGSRIQDV